MIDYYYHLRAIWRVEPTPPAELGERFLRTLELIAEAAPEVGTWSVYLRPRGEPGLSIDAARRDIASLMENNVATCDDLPDPNYGYTLIAVNRADSASKEIALTAGVGGRLGYDIRLMVGEVLIPPDPDAVTYRLFRSTLLAILAQWSCVWAIVRMVGVENGGAPRSAADYSPKSSFYGGSWISYLSAPFCTGLVTPPDILSERTADGGCLLIAAEERLDATNAEQMRRAHAIADILFARLGASPPEGYQFGGEPWRKP